MSQMSNWRMSCYQIALWEQLSQSIHTWFIYSLFTGTINVYNYNQMLSQNLVKINFQSDTFY